MANKKSVRIPIRLLKIEQNGCHPIVSAKLNNKSIRMVIDTGASQTVFDKTRIEKLLGKEALEHIKILSAGLGTSKMKSMLVRVKKLKLGDMVFVDNDFVVLDLSHVNNSYAMMGMKPIDGVIGGDILKRAKAVIDYGKKEMVLRMP
ncbi:MAG: retropepsin-like aspartic protease [Bacteroidota bacterium]|jgi:predicted aspartyl protease